MKIIVKICLFVFIWSVIISWMISASIIFNLIDLNAMVVIGEDYYTHPIGDPNLIAIFNSLLPICIGLALSMRLFDKELTKKSTGSEE